MICMTRWLDPNAGHDKTRSCTSDSSTRRCLPTGCATARPSTSASAREASDWCTGSLPYCSQWEIWILDFRNRNIFSKEASEGPAGLTCCCVEGWLGPTSASPGFMCELVARGSVRHCFLAAESRATFHSLQLTHPYVAPRAQRCLLATDKGRHSIGLNTSLHWLCWWLPFLPCLPSHLWSFSCTTGSASASCEPFPPRWCTRAPDRPGATPGGSSATQTTETVVAATARLRACLRRRKGGKNGCGSFPLFSTIFLGWGLLTSFVTEVTIYGLGSDGGSHSIWLRVRQWACVETMRVSTAIYVHRSTTGERNRGRTEEQTTCRPSGRIAYNFDAGGSRRVTCCVRLCSSLEAAAVRYYSLLRVPWRCEEPDASELRPDSLRLGVGKTSTRGKERSSAGLFDPSSRKAVYYCNSFEAPCDLPLKFVRNCTVKIPAVRRSVPTPGKLRVSAEFRYQTWKWC